MSQSLYIYISNFTYSAIVPVAIQPASRVMTTRDILVGPVYKIGCVAPMVTQSSKSPEEIISEGRVKQYDCGNGNIITVDETMLLATTIYSSLTSMPMTRASGQKVKVLIDFVATSTDVFDHSPSKCMN